MPEANRNNFAPQRPGAPLASVATDTSSADVNLLAGTPYKVLCRLGAGGMGTVLEAEHVALGKRVVVKLLLPAHAKNQRLVQRLKLEARILAQIASPHIVTVSDLGHTADGSTYVAMERLYGCTLGRELKVRGALPVLEAIHWTRQVLAGLAAAHHAGGVHRDVKLENLFLCDATEQEPRRVKVLDFGIAKVLNNASAGMNPSNGQLTAEGSVLGSPRWLAPEQARGKAVDARVDVYAAGLLVYTLIAGRGPFSHISDPIEALQAALGELAPPPSHYAKQVIPAALDDAILMAIAKSPEDRFQSAEAFSTALANIARSLEDMTQPLPSRFEPSPVDNGPTSQPSPVKQHDSTVPALLDDPPTAPLASSINGSVSARTSPAPTRVDVAPLLVPAATAGIPQAPAPAAGADMAQVPVQIADANGVSVRAFVAWTAAMTLVFTLLLGLIVHLVAEH